MGFHWNGDLLLLCRCIAGRDGVYVKIWRFPVTGSQHAIVSDNVTRAPTSGGQYHWVSEFAPRDYQKVASYIAGHPPPPPAYKTLLLTDGRLDVYAGLARQCSWRCIPKCYAYSNNAQYHRLGVCFHELAADTDNVGGLRADKRPELMGCSDITSY